MLTTRRKWLMGLATAIFAPAVLRLGLHMPVKAQPIAAQPLWTPSYRGHLDLAKGQDLAYWVDRLKLAEDPTFGWAEIDEWSLGRDDPPQENDWDRLEAEIVRVQRAKHGFLVIPPPR